MKQKALFNHLKERNLTNRQAEVTVLVSTGYSNKEAAEELFVTENIVKIHLQEIFKALNLNSRAQLIVYCLPYL
tara:strand:- start:57373 stop:57594 length:222 start_codon:yes stop_codon:yes gene_type:complete